MNSIFGKESFRLPTYIENESFKVFYSKLFVVHFRLIKLKIVMFHSIPISIVFYIKILNSVIETLQKIIRK